MISRQQQVTHYPLSKRTKLIFGACVAMVTIAVSSVAPVLAEGGRGCGIGTRVSGFSSDAGKRGDGAMNGAFQKDNAQTSEPNFGKEISGPTGATNCAQK